MKNCIIKILIAFILLFSNIAPVLALSIGDDAFSNNNFNLTQTTTTNRTYYICETTT